MTGIRILGTGHFVPEKTVCNNDFAAIVETTDEWIATRTGMQTRHLASVSEPTWHMGAKAAESALQASGLSTDELDMILVTTVSSDYVTPSAACLIQRAISASNAFAFDVNVACWGLAFAMDMANRYLQDGNIKNVLIVCAESLSQVTNYEDRSTCVLFGDGAGACVVTGADSRFGSCLGSDATGANFIYARRPRFSNPFIAEESEPLYPFPSPVEHGIYQNGREVYKFATRAMPEAIEKACEKAGIAPGRLDLIIPHQANARIIETAMKNLGLPPDKVYVNIQDYGNTSSASIAIALDECVRNDKIKRGDLVCIVGFGAGLTYGASVFEY